MVTPDSDSTCSDSANDDALPPSPKAFRFGREDRASSWAIRHWSRGLLAGVGAWLVGETILEAVPDRPQSESPARGGRWRRPPESSEPACARLKLVRSPPEADRQSWVSGSRGEAGSPRSASAAAAKAAVLGLRGRIDRQGVGYRCWSCPTFSRGVIRNPKTWCCRCWPPRAICSSRRCSRRLAFGIRSRRA